MREYLVALDFCMKKFSYEGRKWFICTSFLEYRILVEPKLELKELLYIYKASNSPLQGGKIIFVYMLSEANSFL